MSLGLLRAVGTTWVPRVGRQSVRSLPLNMWQSRSMGSVDLAAKRVEQHGSLAVNVPCCIKIRPLLADEYKVKVTGESDALESLANAIEVTDEDNHLNVVVPDSKRSSLDRSLEQCFIEAEVPINWTMTLECNGHVDVDQMEAELKATSVRGDINIGKVKGENINLQALTGNIFAESIKGDVALKVQGSGNVTVGIMVGNELVCKAENGHTKLDAIYMQESEVYSLSGDLELGDCHGEMDINTIDGDIAIKTWDGQLGARTQHGDISLHIARSEPRVALLAEDGNIDITISDEMSADLDLRGDDIEIDENIDVEDLHAQEDYDRPMTTGKIKGGGPAIIAEAHDGTITLKALDWGEAMQRAMAKKK
eukprot:Clim_evm32s55 gene=Clim_evmTU32s55